MTHAPTSITQEEQKLPDFLCFAIYSANLAFGKAYKPILDQLGLTYLQYIVVIELWEEDFQPVCKLGDKLFLESNTLTPVLKKLQSMGYVHRQRDSFDERQVLVSLTAEGRRLRERAFDVGLFDVCGMTQQEFATLRETVVTLRGHLRNALRK